MDLVDMLILDILDIFLLVGVLVADQQLLTFMAEMDKMLVLVTVAAAAFVAPLMLPPALEVQL